MSNSGTGDQMAEEMDDGENLVPEDAFWHIEASMSNGFQVGMKVEIEHQEKKYWIGTVVNVCGQLLSIKWEGGQESFWFDVKNKPCYSMGHFKSDKKYKIEPPSNLNLSEKLINELTVNYVKSLTNDSYGPPVPASLFTMGGVMAMNLFKPGLVVEVSHLLDPEKHWFAEIVQNVGGRLKLKWICGKTSGQEFWLFFCHPRVHYLGRGQEQGNISYQPPSLYESWASDIHKYLNCEDSDESSLRRYLHELAKSRCEDLFESSSLETVKPNEKVLLVDTHNLVLVPGTIKSVIGDKFLLIIQKGKDNLVCYPSDDTLAVLPFFWGGDSEVQIVLDGKQSNRTAWLTEIGSKAAGIKLVENDRIQQFTINSKVEVVHPQDPNRICEGIVSRVASPLIWIQISSEIMLVLPYNSTSLFPGGWAKNNDYPISKFLLCQPVSTTASESATSNSTLQPPSTSTSLGAKATTSKPPKRVHNTRSEKSSSDDSQSSTLGANSNIPSSLMPAGAKAWCPCIYFNHKCFTGPSLSKSKICELPRCVGPGPVQLVIQEVISKIISVAYVPSRVLNELSSKAFDELLKRNNLKKTVSSEFKAKYQKRTYRDNISVVRSAEFVEEYCRTVCSHLKCCYNLFGTKLYDGDDCPSNCRGLTKSNKVLKRANYYREKAAEEKAKQQQQPQPQPQQQVAPSCTASANTQSASSAVTASGQSSDGQRTKVRKMSLLPSKTENEKKTTTSENVVVKEVDGVSVKSSKSDSKEERGTKRANVRKENIARKKTASNAHSSLTTSTSLANIKSSNAAVTQEEDTHSEKSLPSTKPKKPPTSGYKAQPAVVEVDTELENLENPFHWTTTEVYNMIKKSHCSMFATTLLEHEIDGAALLLLDYETIRTNLLTNYTLRYTGEDVLRLSTMIQRLRSRFYRNLGPMLCLR